MKRWQIYTVAVFALMVAGEAFVYAQPAPNNCGLNMRCRVRTLIASTLALTASTDLGTVTTDGSGAGSATVRSGAKCFCLPVNDATLPACAVSGTTLSITGASSLADVNYFCPTAQ